MSSFLTKIELKSRFKSDYKLTQCLSSFLTKIELKSRLKSDYKLAQCLSSFLSKISLRNFNASNSLKSVKFDHDSARYSWAHILINADKEVRSAEKLNLMEISLSLCGAVDSARNPFAPPHPKIQKSIVLRNSK